LLKNFYLDILFLTNTPPCIKNPFESFARYLANSANIRRDLIFVGDNSTPNTEDKNLKDFSVQITLMPYQILIFPLGFLNKITYINSSHIAQLNNEDIRFVNTH
jgi:hypothetical protein